MKTTGKVLVYKDRNPDEPEFITIQDNQVYTGRLPGSIFAETATIHLLKDFYRSNIDEKLMELKTIEIEIID